MSLHVEACIDKRLTSFLDVYSRVTVMAYRSDLGTSSAIALQYSSGGDYSGVA